MKILLSILISGVLIVLIAFNITTNVNTIDDEANNKIISPYISNEGNGITILFNEELNNEREGINILTIIALSQTPYNINKGSALTVNSQTALDAIKVDLPNHDFGQPFNENATSYRWNDETQWSIAIVKTSNGYYSRWQRIIEIKL